MRGEAIPMVWSGHSNGRFLGGWKLQGYYGRSWRCSFIAIPCALMLYAGQAGTSPQNQVFLMSSWDLGKNVEFDMMTRYVHSLTANQVPQYTDMDIRLAWRPRQHVQLEVVGETSSVTTCCNSITKHPPSIFPPRFPVGSTEKSPGSIETVSSCHGPHPRNRQGLPCLPRTWHPSHPLMQRPYIQRLPVDRVNRTRGALDTFEDYRLSVSVVTTRAEGGDSRAGGKKCAMHGKFGQELGSLSSHSSAPPRSCCCYPCRRPTGRGARRPGSASRGQR